MLTHALFDGLDWGSPDGLVLICALGCFFLALVLAIPDDAMMPPRDGDDDRSA